MPTPRAELEQLLQTLAAYEQDTAGLIRLVPSEGLLSPVQQVAYLSALHGRYAHGRPEDRDKDELYPDSAVVRAIVGLCRDLLRRALHARHAEPDYLSGMHVMEHAVLAFTRAGDRVATLDPLDGGHPQAAGLVRRLDRVPVLVSASGFGLTVDLAAADGARMLYLDRSNVLYPESDLTVDGLRGLPGVVVADVSQVLGLVVGDAFPNPLERGADVLVGSTHKSLHGPQKAVLATNNSELHALAVRVLEDLVSNNHPADVAALALTLLEQETVGGLAQQTVANARALAAALADEGLDVVHDPSRLPHTRTDTQQVWLRLPNGGATAAAAVGRLHEAGLVAGVLPLRAVDPAAPPARGLRFGTTEVSRLGMAEGEMASIARWVADVLLGRAQPADLRPQVHALRRRHRTLAYCLHPDQLSPPAAAALRSVPGPLPPSGPTGW